MIYLTSLSLALLMLGPFWGGPLKGLWFQMLQEEIGSVEAGQDSGQVRTSEGMFPPPRN